MIEVGIITTFEPLTPTAIRNTYPDQTTNCPHASSTNTSQRVQPMAGLGGTRSDTQRFRADRSCHTTSGLQLPRDHARTPESSNFCPTNVYWGMSDVYKKTHVGRMKTRDTSLCISCNGQRAKSAPRAHVSTRAAPALCNCGLPTGARHPQCGSPYYLNDWSILF